MRENNEFEMCTKSKKKYKTKLISQLYTVPMTIVTCLNYFFILIFIKKFQIGFNFFLF